MMEETWMKVEIWSDFVCPFCYIGKRHWEEGLSKFTHRDQVEVVYRSFELNPTLPRDGNPNVHEMLSTKYGMSLEQAKASTHDITQRARAVGLDFHLEQSIQTNTFDGHRLVHYAFTQGKHDEMTERLMKAYFTEGLHIGHEDTLLALAVDVGLDRNATLRALTEGQYGDAVRTDEAEAREIGVRGVPFFVMNRKYAISGAQPSHVFMNALEQVWEEEQQLRL
jgi:predicted DsbA family dithiol-disulfide isomerase